jgi:hypothetical protein
MTTMLAGGIPANETELQKLIRKYANELNLDSPRTAAVMDKLGIDPEECHKRHKSEFYQPGVSDEIAELRYKHQN